jgi:hypothetical protein
MQRRRNDSDCACETGHNRPKIDLLLRYLKDIAREYAHCARTIVLIRAD